jgi:geranylgeranyl reductase family protein
LDNTPGFKFDVAVIGAGPAGTAAAYDLLAAGKRVLVVDKHQFPRKKACAGGITPKAYHLFRYDISSIVKRKCCRIRINPGLRKNPFVIENHQPLCYMTRREDMDLLAFHKIMEKGADFRVVKKIRSIVETSSGVTIHTDSGRFKAGHLIGADGANSSVRRLVSPGRVWQKQFAVEADVKIDTPRLCPMEFDFSISRNGYYWIFPRDDHVNIGRYSTDARPGFQIRQLAEYARKRFSTTRLEAIRGYPICTGGFKNRLDFKRILLAGDAAGLAEPLLGEGIFFAVKSGQLAARAILTSEPRQATAGKLYQKLLKGVHADLRWADLGAGWFYRFPGISLKALSLPWIHQYLSRGYGDGKTIRQILFKTH